jgi:hypothetical protein
LSLGQHDFNHRGHREKQFRKRIPVG